ncbi:hypothetical protein ACFQ21_12885 [Ohtaekwangia kribbensis]|uniref:Uncharacterized protein n=1 Tax=Ohtaekwangia kribbensis TaxID=688913 RepID=A0ABW3K1U5_9BACT
MEKIQLNPGEIKTIYFYINLKGRVFVKVRNKSGTNKINCWWVKGPFGSIDSVGDIESSAALEIKGLVWGKLKASYADSETIIYVTDKADIASNFPSIEFS